MLFRKAIGFLRSTAVCIGVASVLTDGAAAEEPVPSVSRPLGADVAPPIGSDRSGEAGNTPAAPPEPGQPSGAPTAQAEPAVVISEGRLTMVTRDRPLDWILAEISREGHIAIMLSDGVGSEIYPVAFDDVPIDSALRQLLQRYDAFYYYNGRTLRAVWVYLLNDGSGYAPVPPDSWASTLELEGKLTDRDPEARASAIETLVGRQGDAAYAALLNALEDENDEVRTRALYGAQTAGVELPTDLLSDIALNDPSEDVRFLALEALADDPELPAIAEQALEDPSPHIRSHAQQILARLSRKDQPEEPTQ